MSVWGNFLQKKYWLIWFVPSLKTGPTAPVLQKKGQLTSSHILPLVELPKVSDRCQIYKFGRPCLIKICGQDWPLIPFCLTLLCFMMTFSWCPAEYCEDESMWSDGLNVPKSSPKLQGKGYITRGHVLPLKTSLILIFPVHIFSAEGIAHRVECMITLFVVMMLLAKFEYYVWFSVVIVTFRFHIKCHVKYWHFDWGTLNLNLIHCRSCFIVSPTFWNFFVIMPWV